MSHLTLRRAMGGFAICAALLWFGNVVVSCSELSLKQRAEWLRACEADGNKPYECVERWQRMQNGGGQ